MVHFHRYFRDRLHTSAIIFFPSISGSHQSYCHFLIKNFFKRFFSLLRKCHTMNQKQHSFETKLTHSKCGCIYLSCSPNLSREYAHLFISNHIELQSNALVCLWKHIRRNRIMQLPYETDRSLSFMLHIICIS